MRRTLFGLLALCAGGCTCDDSGGRPGGALGGAPVHRPGDGPDEPEAREGEGEAQPQPDPDDGGPTIDGDPAVARGRLDGVNRPPEFLSEAPLQGGEAQSYRYVPRVDDLDADPLSFDLLEAPDGMRVSGETGALYWRPGARQAGDHPVALRVSDPDGAEEVQRWTITVAASNDPPRIASEPDNVAAPGAAWVYEAEADDPDGDPLIWSLADAPAGAAVDGQGRVTWTAAGPGNHPFLLQVTDPEGRTDEQRFDVAVDAGDPGGPWVSIESPRAGEVVSGSVEVVGSAGAAALARYELTACRADVAAGAGDCLPVARAKRAVDADVLGTLDAALLSAGEWDLTLVATDAAGAVAETAVRVEVAAGAQLGAIRLAFVDLVVHTEEHGAVQVLREYDGTSAWTGDFGLGWRLTADVQPPEGEERIEPGADLPAEPLALGWEVEGNGVFGAEVIGDPRPAVFTVPDGRTFQFLFYPEYVGPTTGGHILQESWEELIPSGATLTTSGAQGRYDQLLLRVGARELEAWPQGEAYRPTRFDLQTGFGERFQFDSSGRLTSGGGPDPGDAPGAGGLQEWFEIERNDAGDVSAIRDRRWGDSVEYDYERGDLVGVRFVGGDYAGEEQTFTYDGDHRMTAYDAPGARLAQVEYDERGRAIRITDGAGAVTEIRYEPGRKIVTSPSGAEVVYEHDDDGQVTAVVDPMGGRTELSYDGEGREVGRTDPLGRSVRREYDAEGRPTSLQDPGGGTKRAEYDAEGGLSAITDAAGARCNVAKAPDGAYVFSDDQGRSLDRIRYDDKARITARTDSAGRTEEYRYDDRGRLIETRTADGRILTTRYDERGLVATTTDQATGAQVTARSDTAGRLRELTMPDGTTSTYDWDIQGRPRRMTDPLGRELRFGVDGAGRLARIDRDGRTIFRLRRDADGNPVSVLGADGRGRRIDWDPAGRPTAIHTAEGVRRFEYDAAGQVVAEEAPGGERSEFAYDDSGRVGELRLGDGRTIAMTYDGEGRPLTLTDEVGRTMRAEWDGLGRLTGMAQPGLGMARTERAVGRWAPGTTPNGPVTARTTAAGDTWRYEPDAAGRPLAVTDPLGRRTEYDYGPDGSVVAVRLPGGGAWSMEHDSLGRPTRITDPDGAARAWVYDDEGGITETSPDGVQVVRRHVDGATVTELPDGGEERVWAGPFGVTAMQGATGRTERTYDAAGRLTAVRAADGAEAAYRYDAGGRLVELALTEPGGEQHVTSYVWDGPRLAELIDPAGGQWRYRYDAAERLVGIDRPNGAATEIQPGDLPRPAAIRHTEPDGAGVTGWGFEYDLAGRVTAIDGPDGRRTYGYDALDRLVEEEGPGGRTWEYDARGTLIAPPPGADVTLDALDRIVAADGVTFRYDPQGRPAARAEGGDEVRCLYAPHPVTGLDHCLLEYGDQPGRAYVFDGLGVAARFGDGDPRYVHRGLLGSVAALTDADGRTVARFAYDPWGAPRGDAPAEGFLYGFTGERTDPTTGLIHLRSRWYDPRAGRFLTEDRASSLAGDPRGLNRVAYVPNGAPLNLIDPQGTFSVVEVNITMNIQANLRAFRTAAIQCVRRRIKGELQRAVTRLIMNLVVTAVFEGLEGAIAGFLGGLPVSGIGDAFRDLIGRFMCDRNRGPGSFIPFIGDGGSVELEVPITHCGNRRDDLASFACGDLGSIPTSVVTPHLGTRIDVVLGESIPIEVKFDNEFDVRQTIKQCRFAAVRGSHLMIEVFGEWPPVPDGFTGSTGDVGRVRMEQAAMVRKCAYAFGGQAASHVPAGDCVFTGGLPGAALLMVGYDRRVSARGKRFKVLIPNLKGWCR